MSPCMACKFPAFCLHSLSYLFCIFHFLLIVKIRMIFQEFFLIILQFFSGLICNIRTISQNTVITCHCKDSLSSMIGKIRMFFYKSIDQRNHIIIPCGNTSVILNIFVLNLTIGIHYKFRCETISVHIVIITYIILRKHKWNFSRRQHNTASGHSSVLIDNRHVVRTDHDISLIIHTLYDFVKLINCCHILVISITV